MIKIISSSFLLAVLILLYTRGLDQPLEVEQTITPSSISKESPAVAGVTIALEESTIEEEILDTDHDGLSDTLETYWGTDPAQPDSDGDGYLDGQEILNDYSPLNPQPVKLRDNDYDQDGLNDLWEKLLGTDPTNKDSDGDGFTDGSEVINGYSPLVANGSPVEKKIEVSIKEQTLSYYFDSIKLDSFAISTGVKGWPTPTGNFKVLDKQPTKYYIGPGYGYPNTKWNLHFTTWRGYRYWIHGAYWHNNFGQPMSHGCVNVAYAHMEDLYHWADKNTIISIQ